MTVSVAVMAHPSRRAMVDELLEQLDRPAEVVWDRVNDRHDTGLRCLEAFDAQASHHLVIQDDVVPCRDLVAGTEQALEAVPAGCPLSLYVGRVRPFARAVERAVATAEGASFITMKGAYWGPALVFPTDTLPELIDWFSASAVTNYDRRCSRFYEACKVRCWYTWPSLVEHRGDESLVWKNTIHRRAYRAHTGSGLDVDWSGDVIHMRGTAQLDRQRQRRAAVR